MMESSTNKRIISQKDLIKECESLAAGLDFSQTERGPDCTGCYNLIFETMCGHAFSYRGRCQPQGLVCPRSGILTVTVENTVLQLDEEGKTNSCAFCRKEAKKSAKQKKKNTGSSKPAAQSRPTSLMAAKMRSEGVKEIWKRRCKETSVSPAAEEKGGPSTEHTQQEAPKETSVFPAAEEKGGPSTEHTQQEAPKEKSPSPERSQKNTRLSLPDPLDLDERPRLLHHPNLEDEWAERARLLRETEGGISALSDTDADDQDPNDPSPAFYFRSPYMS
jgi:hypothetical protein